MNLEKIAPYGVALCLMAAWFALVLMGKAEAGSFINALMVLLGGIGVDGVHKVKNNAGGQK